MSTAGIVGTAFVEDMFAVEDISQHMYIEDIVVDKEAQKGQYRPLRSSEGRSHNNQVSIAFAKIHILYKDT